MHNRQPRFTKHIITQLATIFILAAIAACARMGNPDGGWYDEKPPRVVGAAPVERATNVQTNKINIFFNEFIKIDNATENVVVSPPQLEQPEIKATWRRISVELKDTLKDSTTYTIDFADAILDNNESNPMGNYTFSFSTGDVIDTLEVSGTVLAAETLEPVKGILVGLYPSSYDSLLLNHKDSLPPITRVARTNASGKFIIRGIAPGEYTACAVQDMDGNYAFSQRGETMAFSHEHFTPSVFDDIRQDTIWTDSLHIRDIKRVHYNHYLPDNLVLLTFDHELTSRYLLKSERTKPEYFTLFYTAAVRPDSLLEAQRPEGMDDIRLPLVRGLNFDSSQAFVREPTERGDTIVYWLCDTALVNQDTLDIELTTFISDTLGVLQLQTDTIQVLSKIPYAKRLKEKEKAAEEWEKKLEKRRKRLEEGQELTDTIMPVTRLKPDIKLQQHIAPDANIYITFNTPMRRVERDSVHLYVEQDSMWFRAPFIFRPRQLPGLTATDSLSRQWELFSEWVPGAQYSLEIDTLAFEDIYGLTSEPYVEAFRVKKLEDYASLFVNLQNAPKGKIIVQVVDGSDKVQREAVAVDGTAEFYYVTAGKMYLRAYVDLNDNGRWDTGDFYEDRQPEPVYYCPEEVLTKAKWDLTKTWDMQRLPLDKQKPAALTKQKSSKQRTIQNRNAKRAQEKGIPLPDEL